MTLSRLTLPNADRFRVRYFDRRAHISTKPNELWHIKSGVVRTLTWHDNGTVINLGLWGKGDIVSRLLSPAEPYQIECLTEVEAVHLPLNQSEEIQGALIEHIHELQELMEILHIRPVDVAVVRFLSWLARRFGREVDKGKMIDLRLTHQEIADMLGTTRVTVTRILNDFERQGIIERFSRQSMLLIDESASWHYEI